MVCKRSGRQPALGGPARTDWGRGAVGGERLSPIDALGRPRLPSLLKGLHRSQTQETRRKPAWRVLWNKPAPKQCVEFKPSDCRISTSIYLQSARVDGPMRLFGLTDAQEYSARRSSILDFDPRRRQPCPSSAPRGGWLFAQSWRRLRIRTLPAASRRRRIK